MTKHNILYLYAIIQGAFLVLGVLLLACAQVLGANLGLPQVLSLFGGAIVVEMIVFGIMWGYVTLSAKATSRRALPRHARKVFSEEIASVEEGE